MAACPLLPIHSRALHTILTGHHPILNLNVPVILNHTHTTTHFSPVYHVAKQSQFDDLIWMITGQLRGSWDGRSAGTKP